LPFFLALENISFNLFLTRLGVFLGRSVTKAV
jgi:hypothetical protein